MLEKIQESTNTLVSMSHDRPRRNPICECGNAKRAISDIPHIGVLYPEKCDRCKEQEEQDRKAVLRHLRRENKEKIARQKRHEVRMSLLSRGFPPKALDHRFKTFVRNEDNEKAYKMAFWLPQAAYKGLLLVTDKSTEAQRKHPGNEFGTGIGKTHLIDACAINMHLRGYEVQYAVFADLLREIRASYGRNKTKKVENRADEIINRFLSAQVVVLDDIGVEKPSEFAYETLFVIINHLDTHKKLVLATSNLDLAELEERIGKRITSRLVEMCHVVKYLDDDRRLVRH